MTRAERPHTVAPKPAALTVHSKQEIVHNVHEW